MFNFMKTKQLVEKELKPEGKVEHYIDEKITIRTSAGTALINTGMAVTNQGRQFMSPIPCAKKAARQK